MTSETFLLSRIFFLQNLISLAYLVTLTWVRALSRIRYPRQRCFPSVLTEQVAGGIVVPGSGRLITCLGVDDLVIVDMPDTLLVTTRARSQEVKRLVKKCRDAGWKALL